MKQDGRAFIHRFVATGIGRGCLDGLCAECHVTDRDATRIIQTTQPDEIEEQLERLADVEAGEIDIDGGRRTGGQVPAVVGTGKTDMRRGKYMPTTLQIQQRIRQIKEIGRTEQRGMGDWI